MIIIKFKEDKKNHRNNHYYIYERKSFRVDGKVKKKDIYLMNILQYFFEREMYFNYRDCHFNLCEKDFAEELKEDFYKAIERFKIKQEKKKLEELK